MSSITQEQKQEVRDAIKALDSRADDAFAWDALKAHTQALPGSLTGATVIKSTPDATGLTLTLEVRIELRVAPSGNIVLTEHVG